MEKPMSMFSLPDRSTLGTLALASTVMVMLLVAPVFAGNQQLIFQDRQGTGSGTFSGKTTPFGFWIWCQTTNNNAYGKECQGAMYFYGLGIVKGVDGSVASFSSNAFKITVSSSDGVVSNCVFTFGPATISSGATNSVSLGCGSPSGSGSDSHVAINIAPPS